MIRLRHKLLIHALRLFDQVLLIVATLASVQFASDQPGFSVFDSLGGYHTTKDTVGLAILGLGWLFIFNAVVPHETNRLKTFRTQLQGVLKATTLAAFLLLVVSELFSFGRVNREVIVLLWISTSVLCVISRLLIRWFLMELRRSGYNYRHLLILGYNPEALRMAQRIDAHQVLGYKIVGFIAEQPASELDPLSMPDKRVVGSIADLQSVLEKGPVDEMIVCLPFQEHFPTIADAVRLSQELGIVVRLFPDAQNAKLLGRLHIEQFEGDYVVTLFREQMLLQLLGKRLLDLTGSILALLILSPVMIAVAVGIKLTSPGPVLFVQERVGMNKRRFKLYKFRSMYMDAEKRRAELTHLNEMDGPVFKIKNDPRVTALGRFIRASSIDELPQLLNVLRGHMSLVGPRPPLLDEVNRYDWLYRKRLSIKPGITCLWQISGRNEINFKQWMELDQRYIHDWSLWLDVVILAKTIPAVLLRKGAS